MFRYKYCLLRKICGMLKVNLMSCVTKISHIKKRPYYNEGRGRFIQMRVTALRRMATPLYNTGSTNHVKGDTEQFKQLFVCKCILTALSGSSFGMVSNNIYVYFYSLPRRLTSMMFSFIFPLVTWKLRHLCTTWFCFLFMIFELSVQWSDMNYILRLRL